MRSQPWRVAPRRRERRRRVLAGTPRRRVGTRADTARQPGAGVQEPDHAVHQPAAVADREHEALDCPDPPEPRRFEHGARRIVGVGVEKIDVAPGLDVVPGPPHQRAGREERSIGLGGHKVHEQRARHIARPAAKPSREAGDVHHDLPRGVARQPAYAPGAHGRLVRSVEELGEFGAAMRHEQPLDLVSVIERVDLRDRELHEPPQPRDICGASATT